MRIAVHKAGRKGKAGFTVTEVVVSLAVAGLTFGGVVYGYVMTTDHAEWSSCSLAAQSLASQGVEQARSAQWQPQAWPPVDELGVTNYTQVEQLEPPAAGGQPVLATNYISITAFSTTPPLRQLRADCVWSLPYRKNGVRGPFTNSVISLRTTDQ